MRELMALSVAILSLSLSGCSKESQSASASDEPARQGKSPNNDGWKIEQVDPASKPPQSEIGRYVIIHSPHIQADTILLDTVTGKAWQHTTFTYLNGEPIVWQLMPRINGPDDEAALINTFGVKAKSPKESGAPATGTP